MRTDMTVLIVAFRNFVNALKNLFFKHLHFIFASNRTLCSSLRPSLTKEQNGTMFIKNTRNGKMKVIFTEHIVLASLISSFLSVRPHNNKVKNIRRTSMSSHGPTQRPSPGRRKKLFVNHEVKYILSYLKLYARCIILQYVYKPTRCTEFL